MASITVKDLTFSFPGSEDFALKDVSLQIADGEYALLCGCSGCGKTTLLRHMKTVLAPYGRRTGEVLINDTPLDEISTCEQAARIGYVAQSPDSQIVTDKVWHEMAFGLESLGVEQSTMRARVAEAASFFGIEPWIHMNVNELSGGQKQLVNIASTMVLGLDVLILDEPTAQLDPVSAVELLATIKRLNSELGVTIVIVEQRLESVFAEVDRVAVMSGGRIVFSGRPEDVARELIATGDEMAQALPASARVCQQLGIANGASALNIRDGRRALRSLFAAESPEITAIDCPQENANAPSCVQMSDVWFRYSRKGNDILKGMSLEVRKGGVFAIVGGNGAGKSSVLKIVCGLLRPYRGKVKVDGSIAMLSQSPRDLFIKDSVREDLAEMSCDYSHVADEFKLMTLLDKHPYDISGGELQRAALAKVMLADPDIVLLDEPTKGLDAIAKQHICEILRRIVEAGKTAIIVSHDIEFCAQSADVVAMLFDGEITAQGQPREFFPRNTFYTTVASRISHGLFENAVTAEDVVFLCRENGA